ncbi:cytochrome c family protein [Trichinella spiralis]|uniref:cytochrome c family protein n=1 Tax=Trichinella spiralis TaxID=6334 RepID=UPI0001EFE34C|nr:cytochrome c family protein [Trichinella spiralis]
MFIYYKPGQPTNFRRFVSIALFHCSQLAIAGRFCIGQVDRSISLLASCHACALHAPAAFAFAFSFHTDLMLVPQIQLAAQISIFSGSIKYKKRQFQKLIEKQRPTTK